MHGVDAPVVKAVVMPANNRAPGDAEADFLALHVAAGLVGGRAGLDAGLRQHGVPRLLGKDAKEQEQTSISEPITP